MHKNDDVQIGGRCVLKEWNEMWYNATSQTLRLTTNEDFFGLHNLHGDEVVICTEGVFRLNEQKSDIFNRVSVVGGKPA